MRGQRHAPAALYPRERPGTHYTGPMMLLEFFIDIKSFRPHYGPEVDSASNRNEYQKYFLGDKGSRCVRLTTLPPSCVYCVEIWEPQPPGTLRSVQGLLYVCPLCRKLDGYQGRSGQVRKISSPPVFDLRTVQPVASRYTYYATRPTSSFRTTRKLPWHLV